MGSVGAQTDLDAPSMLNGRSMTRQVSTGERTGWSFADDLECEIDEEELLEFLAADHDPAAADPAFREQLRDQLWALVQEGASMRRKDH